MKKTLACLLLLAFACVAGAANAGEKSAMMPGYVAGEFTAVQKPSGQETVWQKDFTNRHMVMWMKGEASENVKYFSEIWGGTTPASTDIFRFQQLGIAWKLSDALSLMCGKFYFPYGIEYMTQYAPKNKLVTRPRLQTFTDNGFAVKGRMPVGTMKLGYVVGITNGAAGVKNDNNSLSYGGQVNFYPNPIMMVGGSFNTGKYDAAGDNSLSMFGAHAVAALGPLDIRGEYGGSTMQGGAIDTTTGDRVDLKKMWYYFQVAYKLAEVTDMLEYLELAFRYDFEDTNTDVDNDETTNMSVGANISPAKNLIFKAEYLIKGEGSALTDVDNNEFHLQGVVHW